MNDIKTTINLGEYIGKLKGKGQFIIPKYQRGYIWGQYNSTLANNNMVSVSALPYFSLA